MKKGLRTVVMGYAAMGCLGLEALRRHGFEVVAVFTHRDDPDEEIWWRSLVELAAAHDLPVHFSASVGDRSVGELVASYRPDFIFSFYYRYLLPESVLVLASRGALNLHGSLLPKLRGCAPLNWALVNGERETGLSLHHMVGKADAGAIVDQVKVDIDFEDTAYTLFRKLEIVAEKLLERTLPSLRAGTAPAREMDLEAGSYFGRRSPDDGRIEWSLNARRIYDLVRAVTHPYPGAFTDLNGRKLYLWWVLPCMGSGNPGTILSTDSEGVLVAAGEGAVRLITVQLKGQPELPAAALANMMNLEVGQKLGLQEVEP